MKKSLFLLCALAFAGAAYAQPYPNRPVKVIIPWPPGQATDLAARIVGEKLSQQLGQPFVMENKPGAGGAIGTEIVAKAAPDGYTLVLVTGTHVINPYVQKVPFDTLGDFTPITFAAVSKMVIVGGLQQPFSNIKELVAYAKANPGKLSIGNSEAATMLTGELFKLMTGTDLQQVPYKGGAPLMADVAGGHIPVAVTSVTTVLPFYRSQKLRVLGVSSMKRVMSAGLVASATQVSTLAPFARSAAHAATAEHRPRRDIGCVDICSRDIRRRDASIRNPRQSGRPGRGGVFPCLGQCGRKAARQGAAHRGERRQSHAGALRSRTRPARADPCGPPSPAARRRGGRRWGS